jgi:peroxiredoxin
MVAIVFLPFLFPSALLIALESPRVLLNPAEKRPEAVLKAKERGAATAAADIKAGRAVILYYGRPWSQGKPLVDDATNLRVVVIGGCFASEAFVTEVGSYNAAIRDWYAKKPKPPEKSTKKVLVHPGPDTAAVVDFLTRIRDGRAKAEQVCGDMLIRGRTSFVNLAWKEGLGEQTAETLPPPDWGQFLLVHKGQKRRYDQEYVQVLPGSEQLATVYRLMDGKAFYSLNLKGLEILAPEDEKGMWEEMADGYFVYGQVHDGINTGSLATVCQRLIDRITNEKHADFWKNRQLRCYEEDGLLVVENGSPARKTDRTYHFWVDPWRGYQVVRSRSDWGGKGQKVDHHEDSSIELAEPAPGIFLPKRARRFVTQDGSVAREDERAGWGRTDMEVTSFKVGPFKYDDRLFDLDSLPVPKDVHLTDHRLGTRGDMETRPVEESLLKVGKDAPQFTIRINGGGEFRSKEAVQGGKHLLVAFWFCQCPPCRVELAHLNDIQGDLQAAKIEVLAINIGDDAEDVGKFVKDRELKMKVGYSGIDAIRSDVGKTFGVQAFPTAYLISPEGKILWRSAGLDKEALNAALEKIGYAPKKSKK